MKTLKSSRSPAKSSPKKRQPSGTNQTAVPPKRPKISLVDESPEQPKRQPAALPWVEKYKPVNMKQLVGQQTDKSPANKLLDWLKNWARYHLVPAQPGEKKKGFIVLNPFYIHHFQHDQIHSRPNRMAPHSKPHFCLAPRALERQPLPF